MAWHDSYITRTKGKGMGFSKTFYRAGVSSWLIIMMAVCPCALSAQYTVAWDATIGGERYEELNGLLVVPDGIVVGGSTQSNLTFGDPADFSWNILLQKTDFEGNLIWEAHFGGDQDERLWMLIPTSDGGLLCGGYSFSGVSGDKTEPSRGDMDVWILRLDETGNLLWDKAFGGAGRDELFAALEMPDGGFLLGCHSDSGAGGDKTEPSRGGQDFWLIRTAADGSLIWDKTLGGDNYDQVQDLLWAPDGNVLISGGTFSSPGSGEIAQDSARGGLDFWLGLFDPGARQLLWNHRYGGDNEDFPYALTLSNSGKIYLGGRSASDTAPPTVYNNGKNTPKYGGYSDFWLLELDHNGWKTNEWSFGGSGLDDLYFIQENKRGELVLGGVSDSGVSGNKTAVPRGGFDFWIVTLAPQTGIVRGQSALGGSGNDAPTRIAMLPDGAFVMGGHSDSGIGFEKSAASFGVNDFWVLTTECDLQVNIGEPVLSCEQQMQGLTAVSPACDSCLYFWSNGHASATLEVPAGTNGTFSVMAIDLLGCMAADTMVVEATNALAFDLGPLDTLIQAGAQISLGGGIPGWQYQWNTGSTNDQIVVSEPGLYSVTVTGEGGCTAVDQILVRVLNRKSVYVPNVFTPNDDGWHDVVGIQTGEGVRMVRHFSIYDRWGELCYQRQQFNFADEFEGWDGRYRGLRLSPGVFTWVALVEYTDGTVELLTGTITLLR